MIKNSVPQIIDSEYLEYSMYTLEQRAIPSAIDGLKNVQRKILYAMINEHGGKKVKLNDLGSISKFNYHHGEVSAISAAVGMSQDWSNNAPLFVGHGSFGSRMIQEAAAPRYIYASLSEHYKKFFCDLEVAPKSLDEENPEPAFYLPIIPWVLVNGIEGISVGFKCSILPRSPKDLIAAVRDYIKSPKRFLEVCDDIKPTFPHFRGETIKHSDTQWKTQGVIKYIGKNYFEISELPVGWDRETYVSFLNDLTDKDLIKDFEDACSGSGFGFKIKVSIAQKEVIDKDPFKYFKLEKIHTEILTTIGSDGKLKIFQSVAELVGYFCDFRLTMFQAKIDYDRSKIIQDIEYSCAKQRFISDVIDDKIPFKDTTRAKMLVYIDERITKKDYGKSFVRIPLYECTQDEFMELEQKINGLEKELKELDLLTPEKLFNLKLNSIKV